MKSTLCRICSGKLSFIFSFGNMPVTNYFPALSELPKEKKYPLELYACENCGLAQLGYLVPPQKLFNNYHFKTSASSPLNRHLEEFSTICMQYIPAQGKQKVLDIGCNDTTLLQYFNNHGLTTVGIDPALNITRAVKHNGTRVLRGYFEDINAVHIAKTYGTFDLVTATRVLANVRNLHGFFKNLKSLLSPQGIFIAEVGSLSEMINKSQFDAIYHEHYSYFSLQSLQILFNHHGFEIIKVEKTPFQGGELRIFATLKNTQQERKLESNSIMQEDEIMMNHYKEFSKNVLEFKKKFQMVVSKLSGKKIGGFGAPAKAVTLLNYCNIGKDLISFIIDSTPSKQNRFLPGMHIPIYKEEYLKENPVDTLVLFAWNYKDDMVKKLKHLTKQKITLIIPFPKLTIISL